MGEDRVGGSDIRINRMQAVLCKLRNEEEKKARTCSTAQGGKCGVVRCGLVL